jgi:hypothetical protein
MPEAKELIDHSAAWSDRFERDMDFHERAMRALRDLAASNDPRLPRIKLPESEESDTWAQTALAEPSFNPAVT